MKNLLFIILLVILSSCTAVRSIKFGTPSTDTYLNFALDTIATRDTIKQILISSENHDRYFEDSKFTGGRFNSETIGEYFCNIRRKERV